jgi:tetratricopeptide (TPR) repeat protein
MQFTLYRARGNAWLAEEDYNSAIEDYSNALSLLPKHVDAKYVYDNRAWAWTKSGQYDEAIEDFSEAIQIDSEFARSYYGRGYVWHKKGDFHRALNDAKEAHKLKPEVKRYDDLMYEIRSSMKNE